MFYIAGHFLYELSPVYGLSWTSILYFSLGAFFSLNKLHQYSFYRYRFVTFCAFVVIAILDTVTIDFVVHQTVHYMCIFCGFIACLYLSQLLFENEYVRHQKYNRSILFLLAFHPFILGPFKYLIFTLVKSDYVIINVLLEIITFFIVLSISLCVYWVINRYLLIISAIWYRL